MLFKTGMWWWLNTDRIVFRKKKEGESREGKTKIAEGNVINAEEDYHGSKIKKGYNGRGFCFIT